MVTVRFSNVGHDEVTWAATVPDLTTASLLAAVHDRGMVLDAGVEFHQDDGGPPGVTGGWITLGKAARAGAYKSIVGSWRVIDPTELDSPRGYDADPADTDSA